MLAELTIRNFAIIDELKVAFEKGLNVISGETGAGKSILVGAVGLLLGDRASADMIRTSEDAAVVEALFDLGGCPEILSKIRALGFGDSAELVIRRIVSRSGKNRVYINDTLSTLGALSAVGESLINICGQHDHQQILDAESHTDLLDAFGGLLPLRSAYRESRGRYLALGERLRALAERGKRRAEREDLLRFQIGEIAQAGVHAGEDEALAEEKRILANVQKLIDHAESAHETLYGKSGSVLAEFRSAATAVKEIRKIDPGLGLTEAEMDELYYRIEEAAFALRDYARRLTYDPARLELVEERLELLGRLKRKYGGTLAAVLARHAEAEAELAAITSLEEETRALVQAAAAEKGRMAEAARGLSDRRRAVAATLQAAIEAEIRTLRMENARFTVVFRDPPAGEAAFNERGMDAPEFYLSANLGEALKPLKAVASGGELSRIMLALKKVLARTGLADTLVFDEVDSGIGGATAQIVGRKLQEVSRHHQVLCITHLPQIACCGDRHYKVIKHTAGNRTNTAVALLSAEERLEEIARMLGGVEVTQKTRDHAREMLLAGR